MSEKIRLVLLLLTNVVLVFNQKPPEPSTCFAWEAAHIKTFDGKVFSFQSQCGHTLVKDTGGTFNVAIQNSPDCPDDPEYCYTMIRITHLGKDYILKRNKEGVPVFMSGKKVLPFPLQLDAIRAEKPSQLVIVTPIGAGIEIKWDGKNMVQVTTEDSLWSETLGLCGNNDGSPNNDDQFEDGTVMGVAELATAYKVNPIGVACPAEADDTHVCKGARRTAAQTYCENMLKDARFDGCRKSIDPMIFHEACQWDYCSCQEADPGKCTCNSMNVYARACTYVGVTNIANWRAGICTVNCGKRVYQTCAPQGGQPVCGDAAQGVQNVECEEGCYCPVGTVLHDSECIPRTRCPCRQGGDFHPIGSTITQDCNTCKCTNGEWDCTKHFCGAKGHGMGDPHFKTFDGKYFDFMGQCSYYLVKADDYSITVDLASWRNGLFVKDSHGLPSYIRNVTVNMYGLKVHMLPGRVVFVDGTLIHKLPYSKAGITVRAISSRVVIVELPNGVEVLWDGDYEASVNMPSKLKNKTKGLLGVYNGNPNDDFTTPENDIETNPTIFGNKWKTEESCKVESNKPIPAPCHGDPAKKAKFEKQCLKLKSDIFKQCHGLVNPDTAYKNCVFDGCYCRGTLAECTCHSFSTYAKECVSTREKLIIDWRAQITECAIPCSGGQKYQVCGNSCTRTCEDLSAKPDCETTCVEGCNCPAGQTLNEQNVCIPIDQCGCKFDGVYFNANYEIKNKNKICVCKKSVWICRNARPREVKKYPQLDVERRKCKGVRGLIFTTCKPVKMITCKTMHEQKTNIFGDCKEGCQCKEGLVYEPDSESCVAPDQCPCHHSGRSYNENDIMKSNCNTCTCKSGQWSCTKQQCSSECSSWGDSHFKTFDGKMYTYQGQCDFILSKGALNDHDTFQISIQNVRCSTLGVTCSKSVTVSIGSGNQQEIIKLTSHKKVPDALHFKRFTVRNSELYIFVDAPEMGLIIRWDKGTRVYVKLDPKWKGKVKGLCGNFNDNEKDDFQNPSGGVVEVSTKNFGDSWKMDANCPPSVEIADTCEERPGRADWAIKQCDILRSATFEPCHADVPVDPYFEKCVFDTCACDEGGDCECLCTAIAAYAQECNAINKPIKWRSQQLCPVQCDEQSWTHYSPCVSSCPYETCDNVLQKESLTKTCKEDVCVEGCAPKKCPPDHIYFNSTFADCVHKKKCQLVCMEVNGVIYYEGDLLKADDRKSCYCSKGKEVCSEKTLCPILATTTRPLLMTTDKLTTASNEVTVRPVLTTTLLTTAGLTTAATQGTTPKSVQTVQTTTQAAIVNTATPGENCPSERQLLIIQGDTPLPDTIFSASSSKSDVFLPKFARIDKTAKVTGWKPVDVTNPQYLEINLGRLQQVYGIIVMGDPQSSEYVTSYKVHYRQSTNGILYYALNDKSSQIFHGPDATVQESLQMFVKPIEAHVIIVRPQTWKNFIAMRIELIGCEGATTETTTVTPQIATPVTCEDSKKNIKVAVIVSSEFSKNHDKSKLKLDGVGAWQPYTNSHTESLQFVLPTAGIINGVTTQGGPNGWTTAYKVYFSENGKDWNPILNERNVVRTFQANFDHNSKIRNLFDIPLRTTYLKIEPVGWERNIQLRAKLEGCFTLVESVVEEKGSKCNHCPGATPGELENGSCSCGAELWWDEKLCVKRADCPCITEHARYAVGATFKGENCETCVCNIGGNAHCTPQKCEKCQDGLRSVVSHTCACLCLPCKEGEVLCPTSNICIKETQWCDNYQDCPDDESNNCIIEVPPHDEKVKPAKSQCRQQICMENYEPRELPVKEEKTLMTTKYSTNGWKAKATKSYLEWVLELGKVNPRNELPKPITKRVIKNIEKEKCPKFECVPKENVKSPCSPAVCPKGYTIESDESVDDQCPKYNCVPPSTDGVCKVTGNSFKTFDNTEYKYDICKHQLVRDLETDAWNVAITKHCDPACARRLHINHQDHTFVLHSDLSVEYDKFKYSLEQSKKIIGLYGSYTLLHLGETLLFTSDRFGFWIIWNRQGNAEIGVSRKLLGKVDGLCGFYDDVQGNDKQSPDGSFGGNTVEFGDSWSLGDKEKCAAIIIPPEIHDKAWKICNKVTDRTLEACAKVINVEAFVAGCVETTSTCLAAAAGKFEEEEKCRCRALRMFVVDCMKADSTIEMNDWRVQNDCPITCTAPLVYNDCYRRSCEITCDLIANPYKCPKMDGECFPGCYCPQGYVRRGSDCVKSTECRDCECNIFPNLQYVSFDRTSYTVNGKCIYVLSRDVLESESDEQKFQILVKHGACENNDQMTCVQEVIVLYKKHEISITKDTFTDNLILLVDFEEVTKAPDWLVVTQEKSKYLKMLLKLLQIEITVLYPSLTLSIKAPSHKYRNQLEGLCGNCNDQITDDFKKPNGDVTEDAEQFGLSWLYKDQDAAKCASKPTEKCKKLEEDPCLQLLDADTFGQCHPLLDPTMFVKWCRKDICEGDMNAACTSIETYASNCLILDVCVDWRTDLCPAKTCPTGQIYKTCGRSCEKTCDNVNGKEKCVSVLTEDCFCPDGQVMLNNKCVAKASCEVCDENGHRSGDTWQEDACTTCSCIGDTTKCDTKTCPAIETICGKGFEAVKVPTDEKVCCEKYTCKPIGGFSACADVEELVCKDGKVLKLTKGNDGCQQATCVFNLEACPKPPMCPKYHTLKTEPAEKTGKCCPIHNCVAPEKCILDLQYIASENGGERRRTVKETDEVVKNVGDIWEDGPCRTCSCSGTPTDGFRSTCVEKVCPAQEDKDFIIATKSIVGHCCPKAEKIGCKDDGKTYKPGEMWSVDACKTRRCIQDDDGELIKRESIQNCKTECPKGFQYKVSDKSCCGECVPVACVIDVEGNVKPKGESWTSEDGCIAYSCQQVGDYFTVVSQQESCPNTDDCPKENLYVKGCCKHCKVISIEKKCEIADIDPADTIGIVSIKRYNTGLCTNKDPILGMKKCAGNCGTSMKFDAVKFSIESDCNCCKVTSYATKDVTVHCEKGQVIKKKLHFPSNCGCGTCK